MARTSSTEPAPLGPEDRRSLLGVARASIEHGLEHGRALAVRAAEYSPPLQQERASFVTLRREGALRGCIGTCQAVRPLVEDVAHNAHAAAFLDPRFDPLTSTELEGLHLHLSLLTPPEPISFVSEDDLLAQVRPGIDGLLLQDGFRRGTLLPSVWEALPEVREFVRHLKLKAGLPSDYWSPSLRILRYTAESVE
ncbi:MAG: AmmeMemoRadiSam system protein A [Candidatus Latescibacterota bacterium]